MGFGDYLTDEEWDGCFYAQNLASCAGPSFGDVMHNFMDKLMAKGYRPVGLGPGGEKIEQQPSGNAQKFVNMAFGRLTKTDVLELIESGRAFIKKNIPELLEEPGHSDAEFASQIGEAHSQLASEGVR